MQVGFPGNKVLSLNCEENPQSQRRCNGKAESLKAQNFHEHKVENHVYDDVDQTCYYRQPSLVLKSQERRQLVPKKQGNNSDGLTQQKAVEQRTDLRVLGKDSCQIKQRENHVQDHKHS